VFHISLYLLAFNPITLNPGKHGSVIWTTATQHT